MKPTHTGIAVALALAVVVVFFIFPGLSPWRAPSPVNQAAAGSAITTDTNAQTASSTMPTEPTADTNQLQVTDETIGTGATAAPGDTVTVNYVGSLTNGTVFDASANHGTAGFTFPLGAGQVIKGWDQGIVGMKVGGKRKLVIPASLGYGSAGAGNVIPPNATLIFEVELLNVQKTAQ